MHSDRAKQMSSSVLGKKGRSIAKNALENQENTPFRPRKNSVADSDLNCSVRNAQESISSEYSWLICSRHNRKRTVLTESFDLLCQECYDSLKTVVGKIKTIEVDSWLSNENERQAVSEVVQGIARFLSLKGKELSAEFARHRGELEE
jgi:hypothetical protein